MKSPVKISKYKRKVVSVILTAFAGGIALLFVMPMIITVVNSLMDKIAEKCKTNPKPKGRSIDTLYERLNLLK